jgi:hypothetical protein
MMSGLMNDHSDVNADICNNNVSPDARAARLCSMLESTMYEPNLDRFLMNETWGDPLVQKKKSKLPTHD